MKFGQMMKSWLFPLEHLLAHMSPIYGFKFEPFTSNNGLGGKWTFLAPFKLDVFMLYVWVCNYPCNVGDFMNACVSRNTQGFIAMII